MTQTTHSIQYRIKAIQTKANEHGMALALSKHFNNNSPTIQHITLDIAVRQLSRRIFEMNTIKRLNDFRKELIKHQELLRVAAISNLFNTTKHECNICINIEKKIAILIDNECVDCSPRETKKGDETL